MAEPLRPETLAVHLGRSAHAGAGVNPGIAMSSTFRQGAAREYGRDDNETWEAFETVLGALEGGSALAFASGMGAIGAVLETLPIGATVVVADDAYNGTRKWLTDAASRGRLGMRLVDITDTSGVVAATEHAQLVWLESPTNPCLNIADIAAIALGARANGAVVVVDNTLATPLRQRPLALGADVVVHSVTKWLAGHSDLLMGAVITADPELLEAFRTRRSLGGAVPGSVEAWLALRGLRSLPARLDRAERTAADLAHRLSEHRGVERVRYPGLVGHPGYDVASRQTSGPGAMLAVEIVGGAAAADVLCSSVEILTPATSLGGVETLIERRAKYAGEERTPAGLLRVSVGQENVEDLWADLDRSITAATRLR
jgi:cystathionine gamma-synthase